ncbi:thermospermine synthase [Ranunculus cassubicifolius]
MCDIDEEVVDFCKPYLDVNKEAFCNPRLELIINDARAELQNRKDCFLSRHFPLWYGYGGGLKWLERLSEGIMCCLLGIFPFYRSVL